MNASRVTTFRFRLYIADSTKNSDAASANLEAICRDYLPGRHTIEVVDVLRDPDRALDDGILMTPTLVRLSPLPERRIVGTLTHIGPVLAALGIEA